MRTVAAESLLEWLTEVCGGDGGGSTRRERKAIQMRGSEKRMEHERLNGRNAKCLGMTCHSSLSTLTG